MYWLAISVVNGLAAPKPPSQVSAGISISCRNSTSGLNSISDSTFVPRPPRTRDRVIMAEAGRPCTRTGHSGCRIGFPGSWDGTQLAGEIGATYVTVRIRFHLSTTGSFTKLLIDLGKIEQTAEARMWLSTTMTSVKTTGFLRGKRGNKTWAF